jgi:hypothetical protein
MIFGGRNGSQNTKLYSPKRTLGNLLVYAAETAIFNRMQALNGDSHGTAELMAIPKAIETLARVKLRFREIQTGEVKSVGQIASASAGSLYFLRSKHTAV